VFEKEKKERRKNSKGRPRKGKRERT